MLVIRLQRVGKRNQASFRVVLQEKSWAAKGKAKELLGFYNPETKEKAFQKERVDHWISKGAQPSPTVHNLLVDAGIVEGPKVKAWQPKRKPQTGAPAEEKANAGEETPAGKAAEDVPAAPEEPKSQEKETAEPAVEKKVEEAKPESAPASAQEKKDEAKTDQTEDGKSAEETPSGTEETIEETSEEKTK